MDYSTLRKKYEDRESTFSSEEFATRIDRSLSWLERAEAETEPTAEKFIFLWISFNAVYAQEIEDEKTKETLLFRKFFERITELDDGRVYDAIWEKFTDSVRPLMKNKYIYYPFWRHHNGDPYSADWQKKFGGQKKKIERLLQDGNEANACEVLSTLFSRLYSLRNQIMHGATTLGRSRGVSQVESGTAILAHLVPLFIDIMIENPDAEWGKIFYTRI